MEPVSGALIMAFDAQMEERSGKAFIWARHVPQCSPVTFVSYLLLFSRSIGKSSVSGRRPTAL